MKESTFIAKNKASWVRLEELLEQRVKDPEELQQLFVKVSGDLSYTRTFYPRRAVRFYLNDLVNQVFDSMQTRKEVKFKGAIQHFYQVSLCQVILKHKWAFILSLSLFIICMIIGAISTYADADFARKILGEGYVNMTTENINNKDPMAVYKDANQVDMFLGITLNNLRVAFLTYVAGIIAGLGTLFVMIKNGVMVGVFQAFFAKQGLFLSSFLTIWIHGTIEISSIIIVGAAGFILGRGVLLPGSYTRGVSLANTAIESLIVLLSTVPLFFMAGFLEGFVTRMTELPTLAKVTIISLSMLLILYIYVILPFRYAKTKESRFVNLFVDREINDMDAVDENRPFEHALASIRYHLGSILASALFPVLVILSITSIALIKLLEEDLASLLLEMTYTLPEAMNDKYGLTLFVILSIITAYYIAACNLILHNKSAGVKKVISHLIKYPIVYFLPVSLFCAIFFYGAGWFILLAVLVIPWPGILYAIHRSLDDDQYKLGNYFSDIMLMYKHYKTIILSALGIVGFAYLGFSLINGLLGLIIKSLFSWLPIFSDSWLQTSVLSFLLMAAILFLLIPLAMVVMTYKLTYHEKRMKAVDLEERFNNMTVVS